VAKGAKIARADRRRLLKEKIRSPRRTRRLAASQALTIAAEQLGSRRRSDWPTSSAYRLAGKNENKNARGSFGALVFVFPGQSSPAEPGSQIDGEQRAVLPTCPT